MSFTELSLLPHLPAGELHGRWWVAYSGGMDSHVLLDALHRLLTETGSRASLHAIHVHHGISAHADAWQAHCRECCRALGIAFHTRRVTLPNLPGESLETRARHARYRVFEEVLEKGDVLFQAHHQDDQLETLLYRLGRGSGPAGLAGMPACRPLGRGELRRPLLGFARRELEAYARRHGLRWIEDESNADERHDRNFLRHRVLPLLEARRPGLRAGWERSMALSGEAARLLDDLASIDLAGVRTGHDNVIKAGPLRALDEARLRNLLRGWFAGLRREHGLPPPDFHALRRIAREVLPAAADAMPLVSWRGEGGRAELRRYRDCLYALRPLEAVAPTCILEWPSVSAPGEPSIPGAAPSRIPVCDGEPANTPEPKPWIPESSPSRGAVPAPLELGPGLGRLSLQAAVEDGFPLAEAGPLQVRFRAGGESVRQAGRPARSLRKILQEAGVPPWLRGHIPLVYAGDELVAVADLFLCEAWRRREGPGLFRIRWERSHIHCGY